MLDSPAVMLSRDQVRAVLHRTAELQHAEAELDRDLGAMSLAEVEQVAEELGMDRALVRRAAAEVVAAPSPAPRPRVASVERELDHRLGDGALRRLAEVMREATDAHGHIERDGDTFIWHGGRWMLIRLVVVRHEARTTLRYEERRDFLLAPVLAAVLGGLPVGLLIASLLAVAGAGAWWLSLLCLTLTPALVYGLARRWARRRRVRRDRQMDGLIERLALAADTRAAPEPPG